MISSTVAVGLFFVLAGGVPAQAATECVFETHPTTLSMVVGGSGSASNPCFFSVFAPPTDHHLIEFIDPGDFYLTFSPSSSQAKLGCNQGDCNGAIIRFSKVDGSSYEPDDEFQITWSKQSVGRCRIRIRPGTDCTASTGQGHTRIGNMEGFQGDDAVRFSSFQYVDDAIQVELEEGNNNVHDTGRIAASNIGCVICNEVQATPATTAGTDPTGDGGGTDPTACDCGNEL